ncbi:MAG: hypothetical protein C4530_17190 [Desulfobacteraceae bacterium]|nr:MAG: hypothetical protein C4530_17190 [Desulfobacteraceae bacterium]
MYLRLKKLFSESSIYAVGNFLLRSFSVITMPVFTRCMPATQYGILSIVRTVRDLGSVLYEAGTSASSMRFYYDCRDSEDLKRLFSSLFFFTTTFSLACSLVLLTVGNFFWSRALKDIPFHPYGSLTVFTLLMTSVGILPRTIFRALGQARRFVLINLLQALSIVLLSIILVVAFDMGALGPILSTFIVSCVFYGVFLYYLGPYLSFSFSWKIVRQCLAFGLPDSPVRFGNWALKVANQLILQYYHPLAIVAVYSVGFSVGHILFDVVVTGVHWAFLPFYYETAKRETEIEAKEIFAYVATYDFILISFLTLFTIFLGRILLLVFASSLYEGAEPIVTVIALSAFFQFLFFIPSRGIYVVKKTVYMLPLLLITVAVNLGLGFLLIPHYGVSGAAWATLIAYMVRCFLTLFVAQWIYPVPYQYLRLAKATFVLILLLAAGSRLSGLPLPVEISVKLALLSMFPVLLFLLGFFEKQELARFRLQTRTLSRRVLMFLPGQSGGSPN